MRIVALWLTDEHVAVAVSAAQRLDDRHGPGGDGVARLAARRAAQAGVLAPGGEGGRVARDDLGRGAVFPDAVVDLAQPRFDVDRQAEPLGRGPRRREAALQGARHDRAPLTAGRAALCEQLGHEAAVGGERALGHPAEAALGARHGLAVAREVQPQRRCRRVGHHAALYVAAIAGAVYTRVASSLSIS